MSTLHNPWGKTFKKIKGKMRKICIFSFFQTVFYPFQVTIPSYGHFLCVLVMLSMPQIKIFINGRDLQKTSQEQQAETLKVYIILHKIYFSISNNTHSTQAPFLLRIEQDSSHVGASTGLLTHSQTTNFTGFQT